MLAEIGMVILYQGHLLLLRRVWQFLQLLKLSHQDQGGVQGRVAHPLVHGDDLNFGQVDGGLGKGLMMVGNGSRNETILADITNP